MKKIKYILSSAILTVFLFGCDAEQASQKVSDIVSTDGYPIATFTFNGSTTPNEGDESVLVYDIELDKPIDRPIDFSFVLLGGTATEHEDFDFVNGSVAAFTTTGQMSIVIYNDDLVEEPETLKVTIESGPSLANKYLINPDTQYPTLDIIIGNYEGGDLDVTMEWFADNGSGDSPTDLADLILLITDAVSPYTEVLTSSDGAAFEHVTIHSDDPDGDYYVIADVYDMDDSDFDIDIDLTFDQPGVINGDPINSPAAMNSRILCSDYVVLAKITKFGTNYAYVTENATVTNDGTPDTSLAAPFIGTATVLVDDWADDYVNGEIEIEAGSSPNEFYVRMYSNPYINNPDTAYLIVTINDVCGNVTGVSNEPWDYDNVTPVTATGTLDLATKTIDLVLDYFYGEGTHYPGQQLKLQL